MEPIFYTIFAAHYWAEASNGHHKARGCIAFWLSSAAYLALAVKHLAHG